MSTACAETQAGRDIARSHFFARFTEAFGSQVTQIRPLRLMVLTIITDNMQESTRDWSERQYRWVAARLRPLAECPDAAAEIIREAAAILSPDLAQAGAMIDACRESRSALTDTDTALALLDRLSEVGHDARFSVGDAGLVLLAAAPTARPRDVLTEHLRGRERDQLRAFLCPAHPPLDSLPMEDALRLEASAVEVWLTCCRVSQRIPAEVRDRWPGVGYGFYRAAATIRQPRDGRLICPTLADICRRLDAVADNEGAFRSPQDLRRWINAGEVIAPREMAEKPDPTGAALVAFRSAFHEADSVAAAWARVFGSGGEYRVTQPRRRAA